MRVDLDELDRQLDATLDTRGTEPTVLVDMNCISALIAELRAAREVVSRAQVLCAWNVNEDTEWKWMRDALAQYKTATKGDG